MFGISPFGGVYPKENENRVAIYNRCSSDKQEDSLESQAEQSLSIARDKGWIVVEQYVELKSGTTSEERTEYLRMLEDMQKGKFDIIMIKSLDRLMRNVKDWFNFLDILMKNNLYLYTYIDGRFFERESCYLMYMFLSAMNEQFSYELSRKIRNAHQIRYKKQSGWNFSNTPFGWKKIDMKTYEINEEEAYYIRRAVELVKEGYSVYKISQILWREGLRNSNGEKMDSSVIKNILTSPRLYGTVVMHKDQMNFNTKKREKVDKDEWITVDNAIPAIICKEDWQAVQAILESRKAESNSFIPHKYPLSGKIKCGECGSMYHRMMYDKRIKGQAVGKVAYWKCIRAYRNPKGIEGLSCDNECLDEEKAYALIEECASAYLGKLQAKKEDIVVNMLSIVKRALEENAGIGSLEDLKKEIGKLERKKEKLFERLMDETINKDDFKIFNDRLVKDIEKLQQEIIRIEATQGSLIENQERLEMIRKTLSDTDIIDRAKAVNNLDMIDCIEVIGDGTLKVYWNKYRVLGLLQLNGIEQPDEQEDEFISVVSYNGNRALKDRVARQKEQILEYVANNPRATYPKIAKAIEATKSEVSARLKYLFSDGFLTRDENGDFVVLKK